MFNEIDAWSFVKRDIKEAVKNEVTQKKIAFEMSHVQ